MISPRGGSFRRSIRPALLLACDGPSSVLGSEATLALAQHHPVALPFFAATQLYRELPDGELARRIREAVEVVTDLGTRQAAILEGYAVEDTLHVFVASFLGDEKEPRFDAVLSALHRVAVDFFDRTPFVVHLLLFFPDLSVSLGREDRYANAYRQLAAIDSLGTPGAALGFRSESSIDYRWIVDCRTSGGAHVGGIKAVHPPVAAMITILLDGMPDGSFLAAGDTAARLRGMQRDRMTAYSTFGVARLVFEPELLVRYLATVAAARHLARYRGPQDATHETSSDEAADNTGLDAWAAALSGLQARIIAPDLRGIDPEKEPKLSRDQERHRERESARLERELKSWIETSLGSCGVAQTAAMTEDLLDQDEVLLAGSIVVVRADYRHRLAEFLDVTGTQKRAEALAARIEEIAARIEGLRDISADVDPSAEMSVLEDELGTIRKELAATQERLRRCDAVLELTLDPDQLERELRELVPTPLRPSKQEAAPAPAPRGASETTENVRPSGWLRRLMLRMRGQDRDEAPPELQESHQPFTAATGSFSREPVVPIPNAWALAEEWRWILGYEALLERAQGALQTHQTDVESAHAYYELQASALAKELTRRTPFRAPVLQPKNLEELALQFAGGIEAAIQDRYGSVRLAACWALDPIPIPEHKTRFLVRLPELDESVMNAARGAAGSLLELTLTDVLSGESPVQLRYSVANWIRALIEASEPLLRTGCREPGLTNLPVERWMLAAPALISVLEEEAEVGELLASHVVKTIPAADERSLTLTSARHGFPAYEFRKLIPLRARTREDGGSPLDHDPLPPSAGRADPTGTLYDLVVLASALGFVPAENGGYRLQESYIPGDLRDVAEAIAFSPGLRPLEGTLRAMTEDALVAPSALDLLRSARDREGASDVDRQILLEVIAEVEAQRRFSWDNLQDDHEN